MEGLCNHFATTGSKVSTVGHLSWMPVGGWRTTVDAHALALYDGIVSRSLLLFASLPKLPSLLSTEIRMQECPS